MKTFLKKVKIYYAAIVWTLPHPHPPSFIYKCGVEIFLKITERGGRIEIFL